ncbi:MAG TPA: DUF6340 family protein [Chryseolinea sp.]|nr:DUF6340 family protein [Chryseolinea sp.]
MKALQHGRKKVFSFILVALAFSACKTDLVYMNIMEPAPVSMPPDIKIIGVINRSIASKETKAINVLDEVLSAEGPELDKLGAKESITGLRDELMTNDRFTEVILLDDLNLTTTGAGVFPSALSWDIVQQICAQNNVDAIFSLEIFDTDTKINYSNVPVKINTPLGNIPAVEHHATMITYVKTGWRIYDPVGKIILDEHAITKSLTFMGKGINPAVAAAGLIGRKDAVKQTANNVGHEYASGILPYRIRVRREYYVKGSNNFVIAKRRAQTGNWDSAAELWKKETDNKKNSVAGMACYNMAIINEINGELDEAIVWAQKSYEDYNNKLALDYVRILRNRKARAETLKRQQEY